MPYPNFQNFLSSTKSAPAAPERASAAQAAPAPGGGDILSQLLAMFATPTPQPDLASLFASMQGGPGSALATRNRNSNVHEMSGFGDFARQSRETAHVAPQDSANALRYAGVPADVTPQMREMAQNPTPGMSAGGTPFGNWVSGPMGAGTSTSAPPQPPGLDQALAAWLSQFPPELRAGVMTGISG